MSKTISEDWGHGKILNIAVTWLFQRRPTNRRCCVTEQWKYHCWLDFAASIKSREPQSSTRSLDATNTRAHSQKWSVFLKLLWRPYHESWSALHVVFVWCRKIKRCAVRPFLQWRLWEVEISDSQARIGLSLRTHNDSENDRENDRENGRENDRQKW